MVSSKWDARNYISLVVHNGNVLLTECEISCNISCSLSDLNDLISHLGLHITAQWVQLPAVSRFEFTDSDTLTTVTVSVLVTFTNGVRLRVTQHNLA